MSPRRARLLVATVWILSFVICFPPLVGWKDKRVTISNLASSLATCPLFLLTFFSPFFSLIPRTTWRLLKTGRSTPPPSLSPWNRALGSASWPTMPATSFIGEQSFANHSLYYYFFFRFIWRMHAGGDFSKGVEKFFFEVENLKRGIRT